MKFIHGQGMPSHRHHEPGDLYIKLNVAFPDNMDPALIQHLEAALPPRRPLPTFPKTTILEEVDLSDMDARQQRTSQRQDDMDEDDEDGQPRVACANQ